MTQNINLASLTTAQGFSITGVNSGDKAGYSVSGAGDVNGDGYDDIIIGSPYANNGAGIAYVVLGKKQPTSINLASLSNDKGFTIFGVVSNDKAGLSVSGIGDINSDGFSDIAVGAPGVNYGKGKAFIIYGQSVLTDIDLSAFPFSKGFSITSSDYYYPNNPGVGFLVTGLRDINKDGLSDVLIENPNYNRNYVIFGSASNNADIDLFTMSGSKGFSIYRSGITNFVSSEAGDINGDGYDDILVGLPTSSISYLIFGQANGFVNIDLASLSSAQGFSITGAISGDNLGSGISGTGDVNNDGYDDILIGASSADRQGKTNIGVTYLIWGKASGFSNIYLSNFDNSQGIIITGANANDQSGSSVSGAGDVNGDGYSDIFIASPNANSGAGIAYLIYGKQSGFTNINLANLDSSQGFSIQGVSGQLSAFSISAAGDVNGDGLDDMIIGAPSTNSNTGAAYVVYGSTPPTPNPTLSPTVIPTKIPTSFPSIKPTYTPTQMPTSNPTPSPSITPTSPTYIPTLAPTSNPTCNPSITPTAPTLNPTLMPTLLPTISQAPTVTPTLFPSNAPTLQPTKTPTILMTAHPTPEAASNSAPSFGGSVASVVGGLIGTLGGVGLLGYGAYKCGFCCGGNARVGDDGNNNHNSGTINSGANSGNNGVNSANSGTINAGANSGNSHSNIGNTNANNIYHQHFYSTPEHFHGTSRAPAPYAHVYAIHSIDYSNQLLNHPKFIEILKTTKEVAGQKSLDLLLEVGKDSYFYSIFEKNIEEDGVKNTIVQLFKHTGDNVQNTDSGDLMLSLLNTKQILYNLQLIHYLAQNSITYLGYNVSLPDPLEHKAILISVDLLIGNLAAQYLPAEIIMNGIFISTASTASYAVRLIAADYLKNQEPSEEPVEFAMQCASTIAAYGLPGVMNYALTKAILPDAKMSISTLDILASSSFGVVQCYNHYKAVYGAQATPTITDIVMPYITDAITLWSLRSYINFDASNTANLMISIKNAMSVAVTVYAAHFVSRMVMDVVPQEVKDDYINTVFDCICESVDYGVGSFTEMKGLIIEHFN